MREKNGEAVESDSSNLKNTPLDDDLIEAEQE